jgi:ribonucleoside-diphosphate reductase alpha chain
MEKKDVENTIDTAMRALTIVSDISDIENAPGIKKANNIFHSVGLGAMNLNGYIAKNNIAYESSEAREFASVFFAMMNFYSLKSSCKIAKERKEKFHEFEKSEYANGNYFNLYLENKYLPTTDKVKALFEGIDVPTQEDWKELKKDIQKYGLFHAYRLAIAPTQSISYVQNSTASIQPIVDVVETRMYGDSLTYYPMPYLRRDNILYYKSAYNMDQTKIMDMVSVVQPHIDQGISTVLYVTSESTTKDLARYYYYAYKKGLKSLYYIRTKNLSVEECETCSV